MATVAQYAAPSAQRRGRDPELTWGLILCVPYIAVFVLFVVYPVAYGLYLGSNPASYARIFSDPIYDRTAFNTAVFLAVGVNLKMIAALFVSGFFLHERRWIRWFSFIFVLPWAVPSIPSILSFRWMLNNEWGMINQFLWNYFDIENPPGWLLRPDLGLGAIVVVHIWKYLPFWMLIMLAARMAIPKDLYEAAAVDGATGLQKFRYVTFPGVRNIYFTSTLLSTIWTLGDFNSVYLLTGGGPVDRTHVLATLGIRYVFQMGDVGAGMATVITAMPFLIPAVFYLIHRLGRRPAR
jgi:multiple sugar transport system permease protein